MNILNPAHRCMRVCEWPEGDRTRRAQALVSGDVIEQGGALSHYAATTLRRLDSAYGRWLQWLRVREELDPDGSPATRVTRQRAGDYVRHLLQVNNKLTVIERIQSLYEMCRAIDPEHPLPWLLKVVAAVRAHTVPGQAKASRVLIDSDELYQLGIGLIRRAKQPSSGCTWRQAVRYRNGLIICILAVCSLRRLDLSMLRIGDNFIRRQDGWWVDMFASKTRARGTLLVFPLGPELAAYVDEYVACYRPLLLALRRRGYPPKDPGEALWIGQDGSAMSYHSHYEVIVRETHAAFGLPVSPHRFRHCTATSVSLYDPEHVKIIPSLLGHSDLSASERYYNLAGRYHGAHGWQQNILARRREAAHRQDGDLESR
jgi:integrase/recombinase XerD